MEKKESLQNWIDSADKAIETVSNTVDLAIGVRKVVGGATALSGSVVSAIGVSTGYLGLVSASAGALSILGLGALGHFGAYDLASNPQAVKEVAIAVMDVAQKALDFGIPSIALGFVTTASAQAVKVIGGLVAGQRKPADFYELEENINNSAQTLAQGVEEIKTNPITVSLTSNVKKSIQSMREDAFNMSGMSNKINLDK
jgi:hypothetical protein